MDFKALKNEIRTARLAARDAIAETDRIEKSLAIGDHAADALAFDPGTILSGFFPIRSEADIRPLMHRLKSRGARLCLPAVLDRQTIVFRELVDGAPLVSTGFGTTGPAADAPVVDPEILLMPLSAFDASGNRIGYGAGHYDRAIARLHAKGLQPRLIGVAFDCQQVEAVPAEAHDVPLDAVVTESGYRTFSKGQ